MKKNKITFTFFAFLVLASCIPSLHPLYFNKDLINNDQLPGKWKEDGSLNTWIFNQDGNKKSYMLRFLEKDNKKIDDGTPGVLGIFELNLFKLGDQTFLDFYPGNNNDMGDCINSLMEFNWLPVHTFAKIKISKDTLLIYQFDETRFEELLDEGKIRIRHETRRNDLVITAKTEELQTKIINNSFYSIQR